MPEPDRYSVPKESLVTALRRAGSRTLTEETLEADIAAGAPVNDNGTVSLLRYAAWILKTEGSRGG